MKVKIEINQDGINQKKIGTLKEEENKKTITYNEVGQIKTIIVVTKDELHIRKIKPVEIDFVHRIGEKKTLDYQIQRDGYTFDGSSVIKTTHIKDQNNEIVLKYIRDGEHVTSIWKITKGK